MREKIEVKLSLREKRVKLAEDNSLNFYLIDDMPSNFSQKKEERRERERDRDRER